VTIVEAFAKDRFEMHTPEYNKIILALLDAENTSEISCNYFEFFKGESEDLLEELWDLPENCEMILEMGDVKIPGFIYGYVSLMEYKGKRFIAECCASPWIIYWNCSQFNKVI
jgi:hypothetical protein